ncbi:MAG: hypothetical protein AAF456_22155 [Planctomycetota bacterium]
MPDSFSDDTFLDQRDVTIPRLNLSRNPGEPPMMVDMQAFFEFTFWMAEELLDLEAKYRQPLSPGDRGIDAGRSFSIDA